ncbi:MAG: hydroxymethylbilane synthase, partial [Campylobacterota bacterium]|nr:hydroxymethylbilane synthase [Campylobacterota bacterium]
SAPVACNAVMDDNIITFRAMIGFPDGTNIMQEKIVRNLEHSESLGFEMAQVMIDKGALELLKGAEKVAFKDEMPQRL